MLTMASPFLSANIPGRTHCSEGYILWPVDSTCHRPFYQGPCGPDQVLIDHQQGPYCDFIRDNEESTVDSETDTETDDQTEEDIDDNHDSGLSAWSLGTVIKQPSAGPKVGRHNNKLSKAFNHSKVG